MSFVAASCVGKRPRAFDDLAQLHAQRLNGVGNRHDIGGASRSRAERFERMVWPSGTGGIGKHFGWAGRCYTLSRELVLAVGRPCDPPGCAASTSPYCCSVPLSPDSDLKRGTVMQIVELDVSRSVAEIAYLGHVALRAGGRRATTRRHHRSSGARCVPDSLNPCATGAHRRVRTHQRLSQCKEGVRIPSGNE